MNNNDVLKSLPSVASERKQIPIATGALDYFPAALAEVARISEAGNRQHTPGESLHWSRGKSTDHADCLIRHFIERGTLDVDGMYHTAKMAWRALALLQEEIEAAVGYKVGKKETNVPVETVVQGSKLPSSNFRTILEERSGRK